MARICFFARVADPQVLDRVEFYAQDLSILRDLGHEVVVATRAPDLVVADLYFCWWWTWAFIPLTLARVLRRPAIVTGVFDAWKFDDRPWPQRWLLRYALRVAHANIFISELELRDVPARFPTRRPSFSPCVVDTARYAPRPGLVRDRFILTVAWLEAENAQRKGIPELLRALPLVLARHPDIRWIHCGEHGTGYPALRTLADALGVGDAADFRGVVSVEDKIDLMQRCAVYVQPSQFEGFGLAVLEAMACGAAVVASRGGALPEVVGDGGLLLDDRSPETIARHVCELLDDAPAAAALAVRARARAVSEFSVARRRTDLDRAIRCALSAAR